MNKPAMTDALSYLKMPVLLKGLTLAGLVVLTGCHAPTPAPKAATNPTAITVKPGAAVHHETHHENDHSHALPDEQSLVGTAAHYHQWLKRFPAEAAAASTYQSYLEAQLGSDQMPPMNQLLTTARSWQDCSHQPYQVPPRELWPAILPTLSLYHTLKMQGVLPAHSQIRSVYRNPELNACAGGAPGSRHQANAAIDIWVPDYAVGSVQLGRVQDGLCRFWQTSGESHQFGLGIYATGAIHLDTQGYRKWGMQYAESSTACRL